MIRPQYAAGALPRARLFMVAGLGRRRAECEPERVTVAGELTGAFGHASDDVEDDGVAVAVLAYAGRRLGNGPDECPCPPPDVAAAVVGAALRPSTGVPERRHPRTSSGMNPAAPARRKNPAFCAARPRRTRQGQLPGPLAVVLDEPRCRNAPAPPAFRAAVRAGVRCLHRAGAGCTGPGTADVRGAAPWVAARRPGAR